LIYQPHTRAWQPARNLAHDERAAQLVEFAVALPLLVVFVVGIFDFSGAYTLRQKLTNIARDTARVAAADPATDLTAPSYALPASLSDAYQVADGFIRADQINDCGLSPSVYTNGSPAIWTFSANGSGCTGTGLVLIINRAYYFPAGSGTPQVANTNCTPQAVTGQTAAIATCVSISYAYPWRFGNVASFVGSNLILPTSITATAVVLNED
jgi:Flp pilus assembly protein TadG